MTTNPKGRTMKTPKFRTMYVIPDDCETCNGRPRRLDSHNLHVHCRLTHPPREDVDAALRHASEAADRGEIVDYSALAKYLR